MCYLRGVNFTFPHFLVIPVYLNPPKRRFFLTVQYMPLPFSVLASPRQQNKVDLTF